MIIACVVSLAPTVFVSFVLYDDPLAFTKPL
jgi:hypothetical protein